MYLPFIFANDAFPLTIAFPAAEHIWRINRQVQSTLLKVAMA